jgi:hypothetical protein
MIWVTLLLMAPSRATSTSICSAPRSVQSACSTLTGDFEYKPLAVTNRVTIWNSKVGKTTTVSNDDSGETAIFYDENKSYSITAYHSGPRLVAAVFTTEGSEGSVREISHIRAFSLHNGKTVVDQTDSISAKTMTSESTFVLTPLPDHNSVVTLMDANQHARPIVGSRANLDADHQMLLLHEDQINFDLGGSNRLMTSESVYVYGKPMDKIFQTKWMMPLQQETDAFVKIHLATLALRAQLNACLQATGPAGCLAQQSSYDLADKHRDAEFVRMFNVTNIHLPLPPKPPVQREPPTDETADWRSPCPEMSVYDPVMHNCAGEYSPRWNSLMGTPMPAPGIQPRH